jgi:pheromone shutdown protein TraB
MVDSKITACAKVPKELYDASIQKYTKISTAIIAGLELLAKEDSILNGIQNENSIQKSIPNQTDSIRDEEPRLDDIEVYKALIEEKDRRIQEKNLEIQELKESLAKSPNPVELAKVQAHFEGLQKLLEEKQERIKDLTQEVEDKRKEVERLDMFAHYFKSVEVKQIEAPAAEKKPWYKRIFGI